MPCSPVFARKFPCGKCAGVAVDAARGLVVVSNVDDCKLYVYQLADGALVRSFGGKGYGKGQFNWGYGGLCLTPRGTVLVAEGNNRRVQEVNVDDGSHVRFFGEAVVVAPNCVDCNDSVVAVADLDDGFVSLLSWPDGSFLRQFGNTGCYEEALYRAYGVRLLSDGSGVVVADQDNYRLSIFSMAGAFVRSFSLEGPYDVVECDGGASFIVTSWMTNAVSKVSVATGAVVPVGSSGSGDGQWAGPAGLTLVGPVGDRGSELVVVDFGNQCVQVFRV